MMTEINQAKLVSLGFAFYGEFSPNPADPERTIIELLPAFYNDRKVFRILLRWLFTATELIHIERLLALGKHVAFENKVVLGALALKMEKFRDRRWALISKRIKMELNKNPVLKPAPQEYSDPYLINKYGIDPEFLAFGLSTSTVLPGDERKVLTLTGILRNHRWLKLRALIGPNFRADLVYLLNVGAATNPNQAAKIMGCSRETAYRLWHLVSMFEGLHTLA